MTSYAGQIAELRAKRNRMSEERDRLADRAQDGNGDLDGVVERIENLDRGIGKTQDAINDLQDAERARIKSGGYRVEAGSDQGTPARVRALPEVSQARSILERSHNDGLIPDDGAERVEELIGRSARDARVASAWVNVAGDPDYLAAFLELARSPQTGHQMWTPKQAEAVRQANELARAMSLTDSAGGFLVPFQLDPSVIITSAGSMNSIRSVARQVLATGDVWNGVAAGATSWSWDAEAAEVSDDTSTFTQPAFTIYKGAGFIPISIEAAMDEANVASEVGRLLAFGKTTLENTAFITGTGSQPQGIVTALTGTASEVNAAADDTFAVGDVFTLHQALPGRHHTNATWHSHVAIGNLIRRFETANGALQFPEMRERPPALLGNPWHIAEAMDGVITTTGAVSNFILIFGDFQNYVIADRIGMTVEFIPHLFHTANNRPSGQRGWYAYFRVGADSVLDDGFRMLDVASAA